MGRIKNKPTKSISALGSNSLIDDSQQTTSQRSKSSNNDSATTEVAKQPTTHSSVTSHDKSSSYTSSQQEEQDTSQTSQTTSSNQQTTSQSSNLTSQNKNLEISAKCPRRRPTSSDDVTTDSESTFDDVTMTRTAESERMRKMQSKLEKMEEVLEVMYRKFKLHEDNIDQMQERLYLHEYGTPGTFLASARFYLALFKCTVVPMLVVEGFYQILFNKT